MRATFGHVRRASSRLAASCAGFVLVAGFVGAWFDPRITLSMIASVALSTFALGQIKIDAAFLRGMGRTNLSQVINPLLPSLILLLVVLVSGLHSSDTIVTAATGSFLATLILGKYITRNQRRGQGDALREPMVTRENLQLFIAELSTLSFVWLPAMALPVVSASGVLASAQFSIASRATRPLQLIRGAVGHWAGPRMGGAARMLAEPEKVARLARNVAALNSTACLVVAIPLILLAEPIVVRGFGVHAPDAVSALQLLAVMPLLNSLSGPTDLLLAMNGRAALLAAAGGISLCLLCVGLLLCHSSATVAALVVLVCSLFRDALSLWFVRREFGFLIYPRIG